MPYWWCIMGLCTIVHRVHNAILVVHTGGVPLCIWSCAIAHLVHSAISLAHSGRAPLCTGCIML